MRKGKSTTAERIFLKTLYLIKLNTKKSPVYLIKKALNNTTPVLYFKPNKRGAKIYKLPAPIKPRRASFLSIKWLVDSATSKLGTNFEVKLFEELLHTSNGFSSSTKKKDELYKILIDNRPFLRF